MTEKNKEKNWWIDELIKLIDWNLRFELYVKFGMRMRI
jgi:hypothetical protein